MERRSGNPSGSAVWPLQLYQARSFITPKQGPVLRFEQVFDGNHKPGGGGRQGIRAELMRHLHRIVGHLLV